MCHYTTAIERLGVIKLNLIQPSREGIETRLCCQRVGLVGLVAKQEMPARALRLSRDEASTPDMASSKTRNAREGIETFALTLQLS